MKFSDAVKLLSESGIDSPLHDAAELFVRVGGMDRFTLRSSDAECHSPLLDEAVKRRSRREPLQYIIGEVGFYRELYEVNPNCLIPRSDTEILVEYAVKHLPSGERFADLCTGSGCVAISTLKNTQSTTAIAVDISEPALALARKNAHKNGVEDRISFTLADVREDSGISDVYAILSNPPYVSEHAYKNLSPEIYFEPKIAFLGKDGGVEFYESITKNYKDKIKPDGFIAFEIGYDQGGRIMKIADKYNMSCEIIKDYSNNDRVAVLRHRHP